MQPIDKRAALEEIPLFAELNQDEKRLIEERSSLVEFKKGQIIYEEGAPPSAFYCLVVGRVVIYALGKDGNKRVLEYLHHGKYFGIISLLTGDPHSVTAQAINDSILLVINKMDFDYILQKVPRIAIGLSQSLSRRLKRKDIHEKTIFESTVISVFSSYSGAGKTVYTLNLSLSLAKETHKSVIILDIASQDSTHTLPRKLGLESVNVFNLCQGSTHNPLNIRDYILKTGSGTDLICFYYDPEEESCVKSVINILSLLVNDYHYLVLDLPSVMDRPIFSILNQSDLIHLLTGPEQIDLNRTHSLVARLKQEFGFSEEKIKIIINEYKISKLRPEEQAEMLEKSIFATLPKIDLEAPERLVLDRPDSEYAKAVRRIARKSGDSLIGLVLGVGVAYGFCHIGVIKVLEEENIPIDIIAGSSIGAVIASLWATGRSSSEILEIISEFKEPKQIWGLIDLTFPLLGFLKGNKLYRFLKRHLGDKTFYDTRLPLKIIASDVKRKESKILDSGKLVDALMASCSMPGVFAPFKIKEEMLFDGGVINPLPTEPLLKMGVKKIIAVNVTPSREDILRQYEKLKEEITHTLPEAARKKNWFSFRDSFKGIFRTNILDIIFSSIEMLQSEVAKKEGQFADVVLHPDTSGLFWLELHRAGEFARRGEEEARRHLDKIKQLIYE